MIVQWSGSLETLCHFNNIRKYVCIEHIMYIWTSKIEMPAVVQLGVETHCLLVRSCSTNRSGYSYGPVRHSPQAIRSRSYCIIYRLFVRHSFTAVCTAVYCLYHYFDVWFRDHARSSKLMLLN